MCSSAPHVCGPLECVFGEHEVFVLFSGPGEAASDMSRASPRVWMCRLERDVSPWAPWVFVLSVEH